MNISKNISLILATTALTFSGNLFAATPSSVTDNGNDGNIAANTIDNDATFNTRWSANGNDGSQWVQYDFGSATSLSGLNIAFYKGDQRNTYFKIQSSNNASSWTTEVDKAASGSSGLNLGLEAYNFSSDVSARYIRIQGFGNSSNSWNSITDVEFIDADVTPPVTPPTTCNGDAVASADDGNVANNVIDGDLSTRWSANGSGQTIRLDLCADTTISGVDLAFFKGDSRSSTFTVEVSSNDESWTTVLAETTSASNTLEKQAFSFDATDARYVRYTGYGNSSNSWNSLTEFSANTCDESAGECPVIEKEFCELYPDAEECKETPPVTGCEANGQMLYNGVCAEYSEVYEPEHGEIGENDHIISLSPIEMTFDALAAQHTTPNGNGWRHELKIKSSGDYRVGMTELYELFKAKIHVALDPGAKTIVAQHHADTTATITKLYVSDLNEGGFEAAPDGTESDSIAMNGVFDVYIRLAKADGSGETKHLLTTVRTGESFDFEEENDHGVVTVKINGQALASITVNDSSASYFKFGNYQQAQNPETNEKLSSSEQDLWPAFYAKYFSTSKITFTEMSYVRTID